MKFRRHILALLYPAATFIASAGEQLTANGKGVVDQAIGAELQILQGTWEGVLASDEAHQKVQITITGNSLHFYRDANFWFDTTITLPEGKDPKQLHATIKGGPPSQGDSIGKVVRAFFKIEDGTLTLATMGDDAEETAASFEATKDQGNRYELRKAQPLKENTHSPNSK